MTDTDPEACNTAPAPRNPRWRHIEAVARTSAATLLFLVIVALPAGLTYVELAFAS